MKKLVALALLVASVPSIGANTNQRASVISSWSGE
jgi:hypothetical protein